MKNLGLLPPYPIHARTSSKLINTYFIEHLHCVHVSGSQPWLCIDIRAPRQIQL